MTKWTPDTDFVPEALRDERHAIEAEIRDAFHGVTRDGGTSWSEAEYNDLEVCHPNREAARAFDTEHCWQDLVEDPSWNDEPGIGGFAFLDGIGFRYYIAPAMIRSVRRGWAAFTMYALEFCAYNAEQVEIMTAPQRAAVARFVRFMFDVDSARGDEDTEAWRNAYTKVWREFDSEARDFPSEE